jgi:hypothetical protein
LWKTPYEFAAGEECSMEVLGRVISKLRRLAREPGSIECGGWAGLFRVLVQLYLDPTGYLRCIGVLGGEAGLGRVREALQGR